MCLLYSDDPRTSWSFLVRGEFWMWEMELQITRLMGPSVLHTDAHASETHAQTNTFTSYQVYFFHLSIIKHLSSFWHNIRKWIRKSKPCNSVMGSVENNGYIFPKPSERREVWVPTQISLKTNDTSHDLTKFLYPKMFQKNISHPGKVLSEERVST